jgi:hypothetical protein
VAGGGAREEFQRGVIEDDRAGRGTFYRSAERLLGMSRLFPRLRSRCSALRAAWPSGRSALLPYYAAVAVFHVFAEADVGDDEEVGQFLFEQAHGLLDNAVDGVGAGGFGVFFVGNAKEQNGGHTGGVGVGGVAEEFVGRELKDAGHGGDGAAEFASAADEERQDELRGVQLGFADEAAQGGAGAQAPGPVSGKLADKFHGDKVMQNEKFKMQKCRREGY